MFFKKWIFDIHLNIKDLSCGHLVSLVTLCQSQI